MDSSLVVIALLPSLVAAFILLLFDKKPNIRDSITIIATLITFAIIFFMILPKVIAGNSITYTLFPILDGLSVAFKIDSFGMVFALVTASLWVATNIYAIGYMRGLKEHKQTRFFFYFTISIFAALGIAFSANLLTLFIFYEILSIVTYPLVIHEQNRESMTGGTEYLIYLIVTSMLFQFLAILLIYALAGTTDYIGGGFMEGHGGALMQTAIFLLLIFGYAKAALFPIHKWLPTAMVAPTPVSALLHAVAVVVAGVFSVMRVVFDVFGPTLMKALSLDWILGGLAAFTLLAALFYGLTQDNLKRRVAFSTVNQLSVMILGVALLTKTAMTGAIIHIAAHSFGKIVLFFAAGAIYVAAHKKLISEMDGIGKQMPITMICFFVGMLAMIAVPLTFAFTSKGMMVEGALAGNYLIFCGVFLLAGFLDLIYFFPIVFRAFFRDLQVAGKRLWLERPLPILGLVVAPIAVVTIFTVVFYFVPYPFAGEEQLKIAELEFLYTHEGMGLAELKIAEIESAEKVVPDTIPHEEAYHLGHTAELVVLAIIILFALVNYRYFGRSKGAEMIRFDTPWFYGGNFLSRMSHRSSRIVANFYHYMKSISRAPAAWVVAAALGIKVTKAADYLRVNLRGYLNSTEIMFAVYLIIGVLVFWFGGGLI